MHNNEILQELTRVKENGRYSVKLFNHANTFLNKLFELGDCKYLANIWVNRQDGISIHFGADEVSHPYLLIEIIEEGLYCYNIQWDNNSTRGINIAVDTIPNAIADFLIVNPKYVVHTTRKDSTKFLCPYCKKENETYSECMPSGYGDERSYECRHCEEGFYISTFTTYVVRSRMRADWEI